MIALPRRKFLAGLAGIVAAPAIVRASSIMPVRVMKSSGVDPVGDRVSAYMSLCNMTRHAFVASIYIDLMVAETLPLVTAR